MSDSNARQYRVTSPRELAGSAPFTETAPLNIACYGLAVGGAERIVCELVTGWSELGVPVQLFILNDSSPSYTLGDLQGVRQFRLGALSWPQKLAAIGAAVTASRSSVLFTHMIRIKHLSALWRLGLKTIPVIHNSKAGWQDEPRAYPPNATPFLIAVSDDVKTQLHANGARVPIHVIKHELLRFCAKEQMALDRESMRQQLGITESVFLIGMVGQFRKQKHYERAVRILNHLRRSMPAQLIILGGWDHEYGSGRECYAEVCRLAELLDVRDAIQLLGCIQPVDSYYSAFDVFLNTSDYEGVSIATMEAIRRGCPVVSADVGGQREILRETDHLILDPSDIDSYVNAIRQCLSRPKYFSAKPEPPTLPQLIPRLWTLIGDHGVEAKPQSENTVLFIVNNLKPGGAQRSLVNLLTHIPLGRRVYLYILSRTCDKHLLGKALDAGITVFSSSGLLMAFDPADEQTTTEVAFRPSLLRQVQYILNIARRVRASTICFWNVSAKVKLLISKVLIYRSIRLVDVSPGPKLFLELSAAEPLCQRISHSCAQYFQRLDLFVAKYAGGGIPKVYGEYTEKTIVIRNGVLLAPQRPLRMSRVRPVTVDPSLAVVTCCRINPAKLIHVLLEVARELHIQVPGATITVVGEATEEDADYWEMICLIKSQKHIDNIFFVGRQSDTLEFLPEFRAFVMLSREQGCPNASLEAMAVGLPVVANDDGGTSEQIEDGKTGFLTSEDPLEVASKLAVLLRDPELATAIGIAAQENVRTNFSMHSMVEAYVNALWPTHADQSSRISVRALAG